MLQMHCLWSASLSRLYTEATMRAGTHISIIVAMAIGVAAAAQTREARLLPTSVQELREAGAALTAPYEPPWMHRGPGQPTTPGGPPPLDLRWIWIADCLGHPDPAMRHAAVEIVFRAQCPLRASAFVKYIEANQPLDVRMAALSVVLRGYRPWNENEADALVQQHAQTVQDLLDATVSCPVSPQWLPQMLSASRRRLAGKPVPLTPHVTADKQRMWLARGLACLRLQERESARWDLVKAIAGSLDAVRAEELTAWYAIDPDPQARSNLEVGPLGSRDSVPFAARACGSGLERPVRL